MLRWQADCSGIGLGVLKSKQPQRLAYSTTDLAIMSSMKIGTRLTLALLLALAPLLFGRMYFSVRRSATVYVNDLEREMRATSRSLALEMENDVLRNEWDEVDDLLRRMSDDTTKVALFEKDLTVMRTAV